MAERVPAQNRVSPLGDVVRAAGRGAWTGNRGVLHADHPDRPDHPEGRGARAVVRAARNRAWITCRLTFRDRRIPQWTPGRYTPLFFLDEAVAFAAGHRPCAECRRADYDAYRRAWAAATGGALPRAPALDARLAAERGRPGHRNLHPADWNGLPDGTAVLLDGGPAVLAGDRAAPWLPGNTYGPPLPRPTRGAATVITPPVTVAVLRAGYPVQLDDDLRA